MNVEFTLHVSDVQIKIRVFTLLASLQFEFCRNNRLPFSSPEASPSQGFSAGYSDIGRSLRRRDNGFGGVPTATAMNIANKGSKLFTSNLGPKSVKEQLGGRSLNGSSMASPPGYASSVERGMSESAYQSRSHTSNRYNNGNRSTISATRSAHGSVGAGSNSGYVSSASLSSTVSNNPQMAKFNELRAKFANISSRVMATEIRHRTVGAGGGGYLEGLGIESSTLGANSISTNVYSPSPPMSERAVPSMPSSFEIPQENNGAYAPLLTSAEIKMKFERFADTLTAEKKKSMSTSFTLNSNLRFDRIK